MYNADNSENTLFSDRLSGYQKVAGAGPAKNDYRPRIKDKNSQRWFLVDTGAAVTVFPRKWHKTGQLDGQRTLKTVSGSFIKTYGTATVKFNFGKQYLHEAIIADVEEPIVGWDFITKFKLSINWDKDKCYLVDPKKPHPQELRLQKTDLSRLSLAVVDTSFKAYSQAKCMEIADTIQPIPAVYKNLLEKHSAIQKVNFTTNPKHGVVHTIDTGDNHPCKAKLRPILADSPKFKDGRKSWAELEKLGIVEKIKAGEPVHWSSPLHLAPKADGTLRPCGDYRSLNDKTLLDHFPLPSLRHFADRLKSAKIFSKIDLLKSYHQIPLTDDSAAKTTVLTPWGAYKFRRLAMGLRNAAQSFQRMMAAVLDGLPGVFCYLDDILVFSRSEKEHLATIDDLFSRLADAGLTISLKKCQFGREKINFLGYEVDGQSIKPLPKKIEAISKFPAPSRPKDLLGFLGAVNFYRRCLPNIAGKTPAQILKPLYFIATKVPPRKFKSFWNDNNLETDFQAAKKLLEAATALVHPDPSAPLALVCDASKSAIGGCLQQYSAGKWEPLGFWSRKLKSNESNWSTFKREVFAAQQGIRHFLSEINGRHLTIWSDHQPFINAFKSTNSVQFDPIATNQLNEISQWTSDVRHLAGQKNVVADFLSRPPAGQIGAAYRQPTELQRFDKIAAVSFNTINIQQLATAQATCPDVKAHREGNHPEGILVQDVTFEPDVKLCCDTSTGQPRPLVPLSHRKLIINILHQTSHPGQKETWQKISEKYYWPSMRTDIANHTKICHGCKVGKHQKRTKTTLTSQPVIQPRFHDVQIDVVGPLDESEGHKYLLTIIDRTSRWFEAVPMVDATAIACCNAFIRGWIRNFGVPARASSDNGNVFVSRLWADVQKQLGTFTSYAPVYSPWVVGTVERQHLALKNSLRSALWEMGAKHSANWMQVLPWVLLSRRTSHHMELGTTPAQLVLGTNPRVPGDLPLTTGQETLEDLAARLRANAARTPCPTSSNLPTNADQLPPGAATATHVYERLAKHKPLEPLTSGPYPITQLMGHSCVEILTGYTPKGDPIKQTLHWRNCVPVTLPPDTKPATKPTKGRKPSPIDNA